MDMILICELDFVQLWVEPLCGNRTQYRAIQQAIPGMTNSGD